MPSNLSKSISAFIATFCVSISSAVSADGCLEPAAPLLPTSIADESQASELGGTVDEFVGASSDYLKCLDSLLVDENSSLTDDERADLEDEQKDHIDRLRDFADQWNALYEVFQERTSSAE